MRKLLKSRKGSIIPESAIVIPLIIVLAVSALLLMLELQELLIKEIKEDSEIFCEGFSEGENIRKAAMIGDLFYE